MIIRRGHQALPARPGELHPARAKLAVRTLRPDDAEGHEGHETVARRQAEDQVARLMQDDLREERQINAAQHNEHVDEGIPVAQV